MVSPDAVGTTESGELLHDSMPTLDNALDKMNRYTTGRAVRTRFVRRARRFLVMRLMLHADVGLRALLSDETCGLLDGRLGLVLAVYVAEGTYYRYLKMGLAAKTRRDGARRLNQVARPEIRLTHPIHDAHCDRPAPAIVASAASMAALPARPSSGSRSRASAPRSCRSRSLKFRDEDKQHAERCRSPAIVRADLERSGLFRSVDSPGALDETSAAGDERMARVPPMHLLAGSVTRLADGRFDVRFKLLGRGQGQSRSVPRATAVDPSG